MKYSSLSIIILLATIFLFVSPAFALDIVRMNDGRVIEGKIIDENYDYVKLRTKHGVIELPAGEIDEIERNLDFDVEFQRRFEDARSAGDFYRLGEWSENLDHKNESLKCYEKAIEKDPNHKAARAKLGHKKHEGRWYTTEEYNREVKGLVLHEGEWIPQADKEMLDAGYVRKNDTWVKDDGPADTETVASGGRTPSGRADAPAPGRKKSSKDWEVTPIFTMDEYKDLVAECTWDQRKTINTEHYTVYTNVKKKYADKYCDLLEKLYDKYCSVFNHKGQMPYKFKICIFNSRQEFVRVTRMAGAGGFYTPAKKMLQVFHGWIPTLESGTQQVIQHEGTHQFQDMVMKSMMRSPIWLLEGLAVFFESSVFDESRKIHVGAIPKKRLEDLQKVIKNGRYIRLAELIRTPQARFRVPEYNHAWSLIYWLVYTSKNNQKVFNKYWVKCCESGDSSASRGFLDVIGIPIEDLEGHWKGWVMVLSPEDMPEDVKKKTEEFNRKRKK